MRKKRKISPEEIRKLLGDEFYERHERTQRLLAERIAYHRAKSAEERAERS
jgi:hypothetical protein